MKAIPCFRFASIWIGSLQIFLTLAKGAPQVLDFSPRAGNAGTVLTVVGTPPAQTPFVTVGLVRFFPTTFAVTMPAHLPTAGWLMGLGGAPLNSLSIVKLLPGVTKAELDTDGICRVSQIAFPPPTKDCFQPGGMDLGGEVSAGASVFWYYHLTPGDYIAGNVGPTEIFDHPFYDGNRYTRFTVS